jgi:hypothetical protein
MKRGFPHNANEAASPVPQVPEPLLRSRATGYGGLACVLRMP